MPARLNQHTDEPDHPRRSADPSRTDAPRPALPAGRPRDPGRPAEPSGQPGPIRRVDAEEAAELARFTAASREPADNPRTARAPRAQRRGTPSAAGRTSPARPVRSYAFRRS